MEACKIFKDPQRVKGYAYASSSKEKQSKYEIKYGRTTTPINKRESGLQTGDPEINILYSREVKDMMLTGL